MSFVEKSSMSNPKDFTQLFSQHHSYKHHLNTLFTVKGRVDHSQPETSKMTHLRPKTYKADAYREREIQNENDSLVLKIL